MWLKSNEGAKKREVLAGLSQRGKKSQGGKGGLPIARRGEKDGGRILTKKRIPSLTQV